jgi:hypothetical protein
MKELWTHMSKLLHLEASWIFVQLRIHVQNKSSLIRQLCILDVFLLKCRAENRIVPVKNQITLTLSSLYY